MLAIHYDMDVNPVTQDWLNSQLDRAADDRYDAAVIVLDTPGGLSDSMRKIVAEGALVKVPVLVYVAPNGARAASAGVWIAQAADVLAMAPVTNIGSSTPIDSSGVEHRQRPAAEGGERRGGVAPRPREDPRAQRRVGRRGRQAGVEPDRDRGAALNVIDLIAPSPPGAARRSTAGTPPPVTGRSPCTRPGRR